MGSDAGDSDGGYSDESFETSFLDESIALDSPRNTPQVSPASPPTTNRDVSSLGTVAILPVPAPVSAAAVVAKETEAAERPKVSSPVEASALLPAHASKPQSLRTPTLAPVPDVASENQHRQQQRLKQQRDAALRRKERNAALVSLLVWLPR